MNKYVIVSAVLLTLTACGGKSPTAPTPAAVTPPPPIAAPPPSPPPVATASVAGVVTDAVTGRALGGATARIGTQTASTDGNGYYSLGGITIGTVTLAITAPNYNSATQAFAITGDTRRDVRVTPFWTASGIGNTVLDMPTYVSRVRITGRYDSNSTNFVVRIGGRLIVNELLGRAWSSTTYNGLHLVSGGVTEITLSRDVTWTFAQEQ